MAVGPLDKETVKLNPDQLIMKQETSMTIFHITKWNLDFRSEGEEGLKMSISMRRKMTSELMTTYFPSLLLTAITFATTFFKPFFFEAALSVNLTTMLVMTTIFISKMESLPPTSDIKMIDIWLILCQMVPFSEVILLTAMEYNRENKKKRGKKGKKKGKKKGDKSNNLQTISLGAAPVDENMFVDEIKTGSLGVNWCVPSFKTLGEFVINFEENIKLFFSFLNKNIFFPREEGAAFDCDDQLLDLLRSSFGLLLSDLIIGWQN